MKKLFSTKYSDNSLSFAFLLLRIMLGGLIIGLSEAYGTIYLSDTLGMLLPYGIFVLIMLFRPQGLTWSSSR